MRYRRINPFTLPLCSCAIVFFFKLVSPKMNFIARLQNELAYDDVAEQHISRYAKRTSPTLDKEMEGKETKKKKKRTNLLETTTPFPLQSVTYSKNKRKKEIKKRASVFGGIDSETD